MFTAKDYWRWRESLDTHDISEPQFCFSFSRSFIILLIEKDPGNEIVGILHRQHICINNITIPENCKCMVFNATFLEVFEQLTIGVNWIEMIAHEIIDESLQVYALNSDGPLRTSLQLKPCNFRYTSIYYFPKRPETLIGNTLRNGNNLKKTKWRKLSEVNVCPLFTRKATLHLMTSRSIVPHCNLVSLSTGNQCCPFF